MSAVIPLHLVAKTVSQRHQVKRHTPPLMSRTASCHAPRTVGLQSRSACGQNITCAKIWFRHHAVPRTTPRIIIPETKPRHRSAHKVAKCSYKGKNGCFSSEHTTVAQITLCFFLLPIQAVFSHITTTKCAHAEHISEARSLLHYIPQMLQIMMVLNDNRCGKVEKSSMRRSPVLFKSDDTKAQQLAGGVLLLIEAGAVNAGQPKVALLARKLKLVPSGPGMAIRLGPAQPAELASRPRCMPKPQRSCAIPPRQVTYRHVHY